MFLLNFVLYPIYLILFLLVCFLVYVIVTDIICRFGIKYKTALKLPGGKIHFIIGSIGGLLFLGPVGAYNYARSMQRKYKKSYCHYFRGHLDYNIITARDAEVILSSSKYTDKSIIYNFLHPFMGEGLLTSNGKKWLQRRRILTPAFHFNILQQFHEKFREETNLLIENLKVSENNCESVCLQTLISRFTLNNVCETAMGIKLNSMSEPDAYRKKVYEIGEVLLHRLMRPWLHFDLIYKLSLNEYKLLKLVNPVHDFTRSVIKSRRQLFLDNQLNVEFNDNETIYDTKKRRYAMLDTLLAAEARGEIDAEGIREEVDTFMFEGHDTTSTGLIFTLLLLAWHPEAQKKIFDEICETLEENNSDQLETNHYNSMKYLDRVVKESLRIYTPVTFISREVHEDVKFDDATIPAGTYCHLHLLDLHRDEKYFPDPEKFDPDRFLPENVADRHPYAYLPFSAGPRNCIGQKFALLEMKVLLTTIIKNFTISPITKREDIIFLADLVVRAKDPILVKFHSR